MAYQLDTRLWETEEYRQRVTTKQWREILLDNNDTGIFKGVVRQLKGKCMGGGVYEIYKAPIKYNYIR